MQLYYYPENLAAKATFWLWELRDLVIVIFGVLLSILALTQAGILLPLVATWHLPAAATDPTKTAEGLVAYVINAYESGWGMSGAPSATF